MDCESVEEGIGSGVAALASMAEQRDHGREHHKELKFQTLCEPMEQPRTSNLRCQNMGKAIACLVQKDSVIQHTSAVEYATKAMPKA
jgi:hypothetical protein